MDAPKRFVCPRLFVSKVTKWRSEKRAKIERIAALLQIYHFDELAARSYAVIRARLEREGVAISERDTQIAAIAVANRLPLVTHNVREFGRIGQLRVEDWTAIA